MAGIELIDAQNRLKNYLDAEEKVLLGQAYDIGGRRMTRANLAEIQQGIEIWDKRVKEISARTSSAGGGRVRVIAPGW